MATSPPVTTAGGVSLLRQSVLALLAASVTFLIAIVIPPLALFAAVLAVVAAVNRKRAGSGSTSPMTAVAIGCVIAAATYAALAIVNADLRDSGSGQERVSPLGIVELR